MSTSTGLPEVDDLPPGRRRPGGAAGSMWEPVFAAGADDHRARSSAEEHPPYKRGVASSNLAGDASAAPRANEVYWLDRSAFASKSFRVITAALICVRIPLL